MQSVTLTAAVRSNLLSLQNTASLLETTQTRLSTGNKVNTALDNPTNYFTAQSLNSRASDLGQLLDSVSNAVQTIAAANNGITAITKLVESAQATARQALQTSATVVTGGAATVTGSTAIAADTTAKLTGGTGGINGSDFFLIASGDDTQLALDIGGANITFEFHDSSSFGPYGGSNTGIDTSNGTSNEDVTTVLAKIQTALRASGISGTADANVTLDGGGHIVFDLGTDTTKSVIVLSDTTGAGAPISGTGFGFSGSVSPGNTTLGALSGTLTVGSNTLTFGSGVGQINTRAELVTALSLLGGGITGSIDGSNHLKFDGTGSFAVGGTLNVNATFGIVAQNYDGSGTTGPNPKRAELVTQYNDLLTQIDQLAKDAGFNGVNLLGQNDLNVLFNEDGTSNLDILGADTTASGLGLTALGSTAFDTNSGINSVLDGLKTAIDHLRGQASKFGSNLSVVQTRQDFTKAIINTLQTGASNLTLADSNEEAANLLALQTRQSLSTKALSLASQSDQNVLRLLQ